MSVSQPPTLRSNSFYGLVEQKGPWKTGPKDVKRSTQMTDDGFDAQPSEKYKFVGSPFQVPPIMPAINGKCPTMSRHISVDSRIWKAGLRLVMDSILSNRGIVGTSTTTAEALDDMEEAVEEKLIQSGVVPQAARNMSEFIMQTGASPEDVEMILSETSSPKMDRVLSSSMTAKPPNLMVDTDVEMGSPSTVASPSPATPMPAVAPSQRVSTPPSTPTPAVAPSVVSNGPSDGSMGLSEFIAQVPFNVYETVIEKIMNEEQLSPTEEAVAEAIPASLNIPQPGIKKAGKRRRKPKPAVDPRALAGTQTQMPKVEPSTITRDREEESFTPIKKRKLNPPSPIEPTPPSPIRTKSYLGRRPRGDESFAPNKRQRTGRKAPPPIQTNVPRVDGPKARRRNIGKGMDEFIPTRRSDRQAGNEPAAPAPVRRRRPNLSIQTDVARVAGPKVRKTNIMKSMDDFIPTRRSTRRR